MTAMLGTASLDADSWVVEVEADKGEKYGVNSGEGRGCQVR